MLKLGDEEEEVDVSPLPRESTVGFCSD